MNFKETTFKQDLTDDILAAFSFVTGERCAVMFDEPQDTPASSKLVRRGEINGEFSTDSIDGKVSGLYTVMNGIVGISDLQVTFGNREKVKIPYQEHSAFIKELQNVFLVYKNWLRKPTHRADVQEMIEQAIGAIKSGSNEQAIEILTKAIEII